MMRRLFPYCLLAVALAPAAAFADEPITLRTAWRGDVAFFATGTNLADDLGGEPNVVDTDIQPQSVIVRAPEDLPVGAVVEQAFVYWAGSRNDSDCVAQPDYNVELTVPNGTPTLVAADVCVCAEGEAWYDQQMCRFDMTANLLAAGGQLDGTYTLGATSGAGRFVARIQDQATDNASFSIVLVYRHSSAGVRHVLLYDGIWELASGNLAPEHKSVSLSLGGFEVDSPPRGSLTYYVIEGDVGGAAGTEGVTVNGFPGAAGPLSLTDAVNPATNTYNRTINTVDPPRTNVVGVDIDKFDITSALTAGDTRVDVTFGSGQDKVWLIYNIIGVVVFEPLFSVRSTKTYVLRTDADGNGVPSPGDTLRFTIHLENTGNEAGTIDVTDPLPAGLASLTVVSFDGGTNTSTSSNLRIDDLVVPIGGSREIVVDAVLTGSPDETPVTNTASWSAPLEGGAAGSVSAQVLVRRDGDGDGVFDHDDNCPDVPNADQADGDGDGVGDACDPCPDNNPDDTDLDGVCDASDVCPGHDDTLDTDSDGVPNGCESCTGGNDQQDTDYDGVPDDCDVCPGHDDHADTDGDGVANGCDVCPRGNDRADADNDSVADACDVCAGDDRLDADGDSVPDACDVCAAGDDLADSDADGIPDACDRCAGNNGTDTDRDGVPDGCDVCPGGDDTIDGDGDGLPDACDDCPAAGPDTDGDGLPDACEEEACFDAVDNDGNGLTDCADPYCATMIECAEGGSETGPPSGGRQEDCGCVVLSGGEGSGTAWWCALAAVALLGARRRRRG